LLTDAVTEGPVVTEKRYTYRANHVLSLISDDDDVVENNNNSSVKICATTSSGGNGLKLTISRSIKGTNEPLGKSETSTNGGVNGGVSHSQLKKNNQVISEKRVRRSLNYEEENVKPERDSSVESMKCVIVLDGTGSRSIMSFAAASKATTADAAKLKLNETPRSTKKRCRCPDSDEASKSVVSGQRNGFPKRLKLSGLRDEVVAVSKNSGTLPRREKKGDVSDIYVFCSRYAL